MERVPQEEPLAEDELARSSSSTHALVWLVPLIAFIGVPLLVILIVRAFVLP
jgi:hypothetical protein